ncbi:cob(I)yrinic acid a,c-diamide adenosyltransferase [Sphingomonas sp. HITSZ_GF]|uniref:cob(I)yrinic acid a,c-diamide adenosyltransferase n=1 Tax=Sphingomonas sp. HITSZ_GF TaxID=3037247 RepID=UPI00240E086B|nr:cob(I)yrinic acid a,c-diamide adenosyltransferase [Sphingomonas sp. HITSZ_GF]MDG2534545.1 cob(I)yrinic acid a,c-diamide adenosyltransferase [Sphingomonas sp. HITSZ_GF]
MVKLNKIYTRTGDDGTTGLADGSRVSKASLRMAAIGDVDEANCALGVARATLGHHAFGGMLAHIQNDLFDLGADLATPEDIPGALRITPGQVAWLEERIDHINSALEPLTSFVLPAGAPGAPELHLARAVTRRAERAAVAMGASPQPLAYLNRLSDLLFVAARAVNQGEAGDVLWVPGASR